MTVVNEIECVVTGRVQMVMYRDFARRKARALGITGTVRNCADGSVCIVAQGTRAKLEEFITLLKRGPMLAEVREIIATWRKPTGTFQTFEILYR